MVSRFLSPDPYIQAPGFTQSYNRYAYVFNNPLSYIDPSGYTSVDIWGRQKFDRWGTYILPQDRTGGYSGAPGSGYWPGAYGNSSATGQGNWVNSFAGGVRPPGYGENGSGFGGIYYDWYSGTYQSTNGLGQLHWRDAYDVLIAHKLNPGGQTLPPINVIWSGRYGSGRIIGGVPKWWGGHPAQGGGGGMTDFSNANHALTFGGGIFGTLSGLSASQGYWLGKNGSYYTSTSGRGPNRFTGSRSGAFKAASNYKLAGRATVFLSAGIGVYSTIEGYQVDGGQFGYNAQYAAASTIGSIGLGIAGAKAGAAAGAAIGVWFGGVGAIPGAVIGGVIGGFGFGVGGSYLGGYLGGSAVDYFHGL